MWLESIFGIIACEALVQLWFYAEPLQSVRGNFIRWTPFLNIRGTHLMDCKYCVSVWMGIFVAVLYFTSLFLYVVLPLVFHRGANAFHLVISLIRDRQIDLRVKRCQLPPT